ncbi:MAG: hypothetical protein RBU37_26090, partial [Myxococcota bacterium]|nr:hypothetical protein [Myxococcota bacterium]
MRKLAYLVFVALLVPACGEDEEPSAFTQCTKACPTVCGAIWSCGPDGTCTCGDHFDQVDQVDDRDAAPDFEVEPDEIEPDEIEPDEIEPDQSDGIDDTEQTDVITQQYRFVRIDDVTMNP